MSSAASDDSRSLLLKILKDTSLADQVGELRGNDAQCIADLLSALLHEGDGFRSEEGHRLFRLLKTLVKSSGVLPQCYKLQSIQCDFSHVREGGSFADVYEGKYKERKVCVKAVRIFEADDNSEVLRAMAKEVVLWAHLSHANVLPFYGIYLPLNSKRICIISPWMGRGDLSAHMKNSPDIPRLPILLDIVAGLRYLHALQIVHGDLKAKNILVTDNGRALLADFGISYLTISISLASTLVSNGSVPWMAPELFETDQDCRPTLQSDMWSFGCVCYEVFTGNTPFCGYTYTKIMFTLAMRARRPADANQLDNIGIQERELMDKCWSYEPQSRASCDEIYNFMVDFAGEHVPANVQDVALWKAVKSDLAMSINHAHVQNILLRIRGTDEYSHGYPPAEPEVVNVPSQLAQRQSSHSKDEPRLAKPRNTLPSTTSPAEMVNVDSKTTQHKSSYPSDSPGLIDVTTVQQNPSDKRSENNHDDRENVQKPDPRPSQEIKLGKQKEVERSSVVNIKEGDSFGNRGLLGFFLNNFKKTRDPSTDANAHVSNEQGSQKKTWSLPKIKEIIRIEELKERDTIVALMGPTGSGKSSFISCVADGDIGVGHGSVSCTSEVNVVRVRVPDEDLEIVLVDTPGFDDIFRPDYEILELIKDWLEQAGHKKVLLDGILYLHRISSNRMAGTPLRNLEVFEKICGPKACSRVVMMTTMWDNLDDDEIGERRLEEIRTTFWKPMIDRGSKTECYRNSSESAWQILEPFLRNQRQQLATRQLQRVAVPQQSQKVASRLQHETVQQQQALPSTGAGQALYEKIEALDRQRKSVMRTLEKQMNKRGTDNEIVDLLRQQYERLEREQEAALGELHEQKIPVSQRFLKSVAMKKRFRR